MMETLSFDGSMISGNRFSKKGQPRKIEGFICHIIAEMRKKKQ